VNSSSIINGSHCSANDQVKKIEEEQAIKEESDDTRIDFEIQRSGIQKGRQPCGMITQLIY
jgi:hypothetical protein